ncbi:toprim domain-containing protein [Streptomyces sp. NPDC058525]|uniref:toprim domain-containing protein n=1 Tax=Streptomyces sp. NPDC058525 TaxID=3346538 RepID=UPI00364CC390
MPNTAGGEHTHPVIREPDAGSAEVAFSDPGAVEVWDGEGGGSPEIWEAVRVADYMTDLQADINVRVETELRAETGMDAENQERLELAKVHASIVVPSLGWSRQLADVMRLAADGRLIVDSDGLFRQRTEGSGAGRRVSNSRVRLLLKSSFLSLPAGESSAGAVRPTVQGEQALFLADLYPEGLHADDTTAYEARLKASRRHWRSSEENKDAARRLPPLERWAMKWPEDRQPQRLSESEHADAVYALAVFAYRDLDAVVTRLWKPGVKAGDLVAIGNRLTAAQQKLGQDDRGGAAADLRAARALAERYAASIEGDPRAEEANTWTRRLHERIDQYLAHWPGADAPTQSPGREAAEVLQPVAMATRRGVPPTHTAEGAPLTSPQENVTRPPTSEGAKPIRDGQPEVSDADSQLATSPPAPSASPQASEPPRTAAVPSTAKTAASGDGAISAQDTSRLLQVEWTLDLGPTPPPMGDEERATAIAMRASLPADGLVDLLAAAYDDQAYSEWKRRYLMSRSAGATQVGATEVRYEHYANHLEATVGDVSVTVAWPRVRAWVREIATPEVVGFLTKAKAVSRRFPQNRQGEERWQAMGELALARTLRERVEAAKRQVLDHAIGYLASRSIPATARRSRPTAASAGGLGLFDADGPFALPPMGELSQDFDRIIALLPDPGQEAPKRFAPLSELTPGMVIELDDSPIVIAEIDSHPGRVDIIGEHRGPVRPHRVKHSLDLSAESDPALQLAELPPSLAPLIGPVPLREGGTGRGPLVAGHPDANIPIRPGAGRSAPQLPAGPPLPRLDVFVWDEERRRSHGKAIALRAGGMPPVSAARRQMDPDDPFTQFVDNLEHQLMQLSDRAAEHAVVERAAAEIREGVTDLAARARAYSAERLRQAEQNPARLLQITMEPSLSGPFRRLAMNTVMAAIDRAEAAVSEAGQQARVRAALEAVVCTRPPREPRGDTQADFGDALVPFTSMDERTSATVAELLATPAQWEHFNLMAAEVHALTNRAAAVGEEPAARFATVDEVRLHLSSVANEEISGDSGPQRERAQNRSRRAARLAADPSLELAPSGRLALHGSPRDGWHVVAPGSGADVVPWPVRTRKHALAFADLMDRLTDDSGEAHPWDADDFPGHSGSQVHGVSLLYDWVTSSPSHTAYSFRDRLKGLRQRSASAGWMEDLALHRFSDYGFIHPAAPDQLSPGDEIMFAFDQDELTYASAVAGYFPPPYMRNRAIGTAAVGADGSLIPGHWWPEGRPDEVQKLDLPVRLREGVRRARTGEYQLHEGITAHLPASEQRADTSPVAIGQAAPQPWVQEAPAAFAQAPTGLSWVQPEGVPSDLGAAQSPGESADSSAQATPGTGQASAPVAAEGPREGSDAERRPAEPGQGQAEASEEPAVPGAVRQRGSMEVALPKLKKAQRTALEEVARGLVSRFGGLFMKQTHAVRREAARSQNAVADLLEMGLVEADGRQVQLTSRGDAWFAHNGVERPAGSEESWAAGETPYLAAAGSIEQSQLLLAPASIDYSQASPAQVTFEPDWPHPPSPAPFPDNWYKTSPDEGAISAARRQARRAQERFAHSTARDVAALAMADDEQRWIWTRARPLAQFDENAAAALERLTDPATFAYSTQALLNLRAVLEGVGRGATEDYLQRILSAGSDPAAMDKAWRTDLGVATDPTYTTHVRAVVINYLMQTAAHAEAAGLDAVAVIDVLEDAGGWDGHLPQFGRSQSGFPHFPAAEAVVQSAQFVASAAREQLMGASETVQAWIEQQRNAEDVEPRNPGGLPAAGREGVVTVPPGHGGQAAPTAGTSAVHLGDPDQAETPEPVLEALQVNGPGDRADTMPPVAATGDGAAEPGEPNRGASAAKKDGEQASDSARLGGAATSEGERADSQTGPGPSLEADPQPASEESSREARPGGDAAATQEGANAERWPGAAYAYAREATHDWRRLVDAMAALDESHRTWPRTSRSHVELTNVKSAVSRIDGQMPAVPAVLPEVAHQLRELDGMLDVVRDDLARSGDEELRRRLTPLLSAVTEAHGQTHDRTQASARQLTRNTAGTWLHPWVTELPEGTRANHEVRLAHTAERPGRILHADGTLLQHIGAGEESVARPARAAGIVDAPRGTGAWQVVRFEDGTHEVVHPALLHPADQDPYPLQDGIDLTAEAWALRWQAFDRAEAAGATAAVLGAFFVVPGDRIRVPGRKGERTVTSVEHGARRRSGRKQVAGTALMHHGAGTVRTVEYMATDPYAAMPLALPEVHPGLAANPFFDPSEVILTQDPIPADSFHKFSYTWSATVAGGHEGTYSITGDCQGKVRNGIPDHKTYRVHYAHGFADGQHEEAQVWALGLATTLKGAAEYISAHWTRSQTGDHRAEAQQDDYASGLWLLPDVGEGEYLVYRPDRSWELTSREGNVYDIRYEGTTRAGNLEVRHEGELVGVTTERYEKKWPQMLALVRDHSAPQPETPTAAVPSAEVLADAPERDVSPDADVDQAATGGHISSADEVARPDVAVAGAEEPDALFDLVATEGERVGEGIQTAAQVRPAGPVVGPMAQTAETAARADLGIAPLEGEGVDEHSDRFDGNSRPPADSDPGPLQQAQLTGDLEPGHGDLQEQPGAKPANPTEREDVPLPRAGRSLQEAPVTSHEEGVTPPQGGRSHQSRSEAEVAAGTLRAEPSPEATRDLETAGQDSSRESAVPAGDEDRERPVEEPVGMAKSSTGHASQNDSAERPATVPTEAEVAEHADADAVDRKSSPRQPPGAAGAYADPSAYEVAHEALLAVLDQHEDWLTEDAAAAAAADALVTTSGVAPPALAALLALDASARTAEGRGDTHAAFAEQLRHHVRCTQLTMAKIVVGQATRTTDLARLRDLHVVAFEGQFIGFRQTTDAGEMEVGQYFGHRADQINQQTTAAADTAELGAETPEEDVTVDEGDEVGLPAIELPDGAGVFFSHAEGAPQLHARAVELVRSPPGTSGELAYLDGRPVYVMVTEQAGAAEPALGALLLGQSTGNDARTVHITAAELAAVEPARLMAAVTAWMAADDAGARPLLDYEQGPGGAPETPGPVTATPEAQPTLASRAPDAAPAAANAAAEPERAQSPADNLMPAAESLPLPREGAAPMTTPQPGPETSELPQPAAPAAGRTPTVERPVVQPAEGDEQRPITVPQAPATAAPAMPAARQEELGAADRLAGLARQALASLGSSREVTATMAAPDHVLVTVEATGDTSRDQYLTEGLQQALNTAITGQPDRSLDRLRVDVQHARTGQTLLPANGPAPTPANEAVPRARLIAVNAEAARIFASRLRTDANAELARTYLHEGDAAAGIQGRQIPPEVQEQWGVGYAPSDRSAGRWDVLAQELQRAGFSEDELVQSGLAKRSSKGTLYDAFADRIMFPIHDQVGEIVGFGGRRIDRPGESGSQAQERGGPKYLNTRETAIFRKGELVFGLYHPAQAEARQASIGPRVGLEGYLDVIAMARAGEARPLEQRPVAGAPMGTALTKDQLTALRGIQDGTPRTHVMFSDNDPSGQRALLNSWDLLLTTPGTTEVTRAEDVKDAADLWETGVTSGAGGAQQVLHALDQRQPLLDAAVEAQLIDFADAAERANHTFDSGAFNSRSRAAATHAARLIHAEAQHRAPQDAQELQQAALTWAKRLHQNWKLPGHLVATAVLLGPGNHDDDHHNAVYEQALDLLAADPDGYFADDQHVRSRNSAILADEHQPTASAAPGTSPTAGATGTGLWPAGTNRPGAQAPATATQAGEPAAFTMSLPGPGPSATLTEITDRTAAAYGLHVAVYDRLGQHAIEDESPGQLAKPLPLGSLYGIPLATSGADQRTEDPSIVVWLGTDSLRLSYRRFTAMTPAEFLAAVEWRAAAAAGGIGAPLSRTWRDAVRTILPRSLPHTPNTDEFAALLDTVAASAEGRTEETRRRGRQAVELYTAGHPDLAVDHLAAADHIWVLRNDGGWVQETAAAQPSWNDVSERLAQEASVLSQLGQEAAAHPASDPTAAELPIAADLTVAHHSAHEAMAVLRPYSIGLPGTVYERITDLVAQMDSSVPAVRRLRGPDGERLMGRARSSLVRALQGLATVAGKIRLSGLADRLERAVARLRGQEGRPQSERAVRADRRLQDLSHTERDLERRMAAPGTTMQEIGELQEQWIINRARWRARYEQIAGQPPTTDFLPSNGLIAGAPPIPNPVTGHDLLVTRLRNRVAEERDIDPHTGEMSDPWNPTADLLTGVAWAYQQRLIGSIPTGPDPEGPVLPDQLRQAALIVTARREASPLTLRRAMAISAERADRLLDRLEAQQILGPYRPDATRTVLAQSSDIDALLARPPHPRAPAPRPPAAVPPPTTPMEAEGVSETDLNGRRAEIEEVVTKFLAEQAARTTGQPDDQGDQAATASRVRTATRHEAQANALTTRQTTQLTPSQF